MSQRSPNPVSKGFTLIELLVTISIFIFMTALIVSRYGAFNQGTLMTNLAYDVALSVRTAQTYGVSVKGIEDTSSHPGQGFNQTFTGAYGVHLDSTVAGNSSCSPAPTVNRSKFVIFSDSDLNNFYDSDCSDAVFATYNMKQGATVSGLCAGTDGQSCSSGNLAYLDVTFKRPDPTAVICVNDLCTNGAVPYNYAKITLTSGDTTSSRTVIIRGNGQISVGN